MKLCSQSEGTLPLRMIAAVRSWMMEAPVSLAACIISTTIGSLCFQRQPFRILMTDSSVILCWQTRFQVASDFYYLSNTCPHINVVWPIFSFARNFTQIMFT